MSVNRKLLCVLWILSSAGIAGLTTAMAYKDNTTIVQKAKPSHNINRIGKTDKWVKPTALPTPTPTPAPTPTFRMRKFWYA